MVAVMRVDELIHYVFDGATTTLAVQCAAWMGGSRRFTAFVEAYRDKIRKKVSVCHDEDEQRNLQAELATAYRLLHDRRLAVEYEAYSAGKQRGPDFRVIFKTHTPFNVEVTRLRTGDSTPQGREANTAADPSLCHGSPGAYQRSVGALAPSAAGRKLLSTVGDKLTQMPPGIVNVLLVATDPPLYTLADVTVAMRALKAQAEQGDELFFRRHGFDSAREFFKHSARLSALLLRDATCDGPVSQAVLWLNPEARHPLPPALHAILS
jgi:hypothetical protein